MEKKALLTIDDSPSFHFREKVDILLRKGIFAIFFCQGNLLEKYPDDVIYAIRNGFIIGNHSYSHPKFSDISLDKGIEEINRTDQLIEDLYNEAGVKQDMKYFRYPHGIKGNITYLSPKILLKRFDKKFVALDAHLKQLGYKKLEFKKPKLRYPEMLRLSDHDVYWTIDVREWRLRKKNTVRTIEYVEDFIEKNLSYSRGNEIILVHDHVETHKYFEHILDLIISKGFAFFPLLKNNQTPHAEHYYSSL